MSNYKDYRECFELAGAEVLAWEYFGSYQGEVLAKIRYEGREGWLKFAFGSCSGCDDLESFMMVVDIDSADGSDYPTDEQWAEFGRGYVEGLGTWEEVYQVVAEAAEWDSEAGEMLQFLDANR